VDISVFPLAFPLIAGPGALAVILLAFVDVPFGSPQFAGQLLVIALVLGITLGLMLVTGPVMRLVGETGGAVLGRLLGVLLAALASQFVIDGLRGALGDL
jgi:multiple antibiotic resistance protein